MSVEGTIKIDQEAKMKRYEDTILLSGVKALSIAFGRTPEFWKSEQDRIANKRKEKMNASGT